MCWKYFNECLKRGLHCQIYFTFSLTPIQLTHKYQCNHLKNKRISYKSTLFLAPQHIQFTTHFDFESKKIVPEQVYIKRHAKYKQKMS